MVLPCVVYRAGLYGALALAVLAPGVAGWFVGEWLWFDGVLGVLALYGLLLALLFLAERIFTGIVAFVAFVPVVYLLILFVQVLLMSL